MYLLQRISLSFCSLTTRTPLTINPHFSSDLSLRSQFNSLETLGPAVLIFDSIMSLFPPYIGLNMTYRVCDNCGYGNSIDASHCEECGHYFQSLTDLFIPFLHKSPSRSLLRRLLKLIVLIISITLSCFLAMFLYAKF